MVPTKVPLNFKFIVRMENKASGELICSGWSSRITLPEERPPDPADFSIEDKQKSLHVLQDLLASSPSSFSGSATERAQLLILLSEHIELPQWTHTDTLCMADVNVNEMDWSSPEHRALAGQILKQMLALEGLVSLTQLLGIESKQ